MRRVDEPVPLFVSVAFTAAVLICVALSGGCSISKLDATTTALGASRTAHNTTVDISETALEAKLREVGEECIAELGAVPECTARVDAEAAEWEELAQASKTAALAGDTVSLVVYRWAQDVDDGEGDPDEVPLSVRVELETWCPLVDRWLDHAEDRGARIPAVVRRAIAGACNE